MAACLARKIYGTCLKIGLKHYLVVVFWCGTIGSIAKRNGCTHFPLWVVTYVFVPSGQPEKSRPAQGQQAQTRTREARSSPGAAIPACAEQSHDKPERTGFEALGCASEKVCADGPSGRAG